MQLTDRYRLGRGSFPLSGYMEFNMTNMTNLRYDEGFAVDDFLALANRVWPRAYARDDAARHRATAHGACSRARPARQARVRSAAASAP